MLRNALEVRTGGAIRTVVPGSAESAALNKAALIAGDMWSQYFEVATGPDAEVFTDPVVSGLAPVKLRVSLG